MYLGRGSSERAVGFVLGFKHPLAIRCLTQDDVSALPTNRHSDLLAQGDLSDAGAIKGLEPLLVELSKALDGSP